MKLKILIDRNLEGECGKMNEVTFNKLKKIRKIILNKNYSFVIGDLERESVIVKVIKNNNLENNILYVSSKVKEIYYPNKDEINIT